MSLDIQAWGPGAARGLLAMMTCLSLYVTCSASEFQVNLTTAGTQGLPEVAADASGRFIVVWETARDSSYETLDIKGQRFDPGGVPVGGEFVVNTSDISVEYLGSLSNAAAGMNDAGDFVIAWQSFYYSFPDSYYAWDVLFRRFDSGGTPLADESTLGPSTGPANRRAPAVGVGPGGDSLLVWMEGGGLALARHIDPNGAPQGGEVLLAPVNAPFGTHSVASRASLGSVVAWGSFGDGSQSAILGRRFDEASQPSGDAFQINSFSLGYQVRPSVAAGGDGGFVSVWGSQDQDGDKEGIFGQLFDSSARPLFGEFQVNSFTTGRQSHADVAMDGQGDFMVVWQSEGQDGSGLGVFGQLFDIAANRLGGEFQVNGDAAANQGSPSIASTGIGEFVAVWEGYDGSSSGIWGVLIQSCPQVPAPVGNLVVERSPTAQELIFTWDDAAEAENFILLEANEPSGSFTPLASAVRDIGISCGNDLCEPFHGENCSSCAADCNGRLSGSPALRFCCGDGLSGPENPVDCGDPRCTDGQVGCEAEALLSIPDPAGDRFFLMAGSNMCGTGPLR